ncbi:MAG: hypothetical protein ACTHMU_01820 [Thermomicrobiales bacterium]
MTRPRVAAIITTYFPGSHADVIVTRLLAGYTLYGVATEPRVEVASMYLDQIAAKDIGRDLAARHGVPIFESIGEALAVGGHGLNVEGVVIIGEHGHYPVNEYEQTLYPRRRLFDAVVAAMVGAGRIVPIFSDKHLSWSFAYARRMVDTATRLGISFLAGSSLPLAWRRPVLDWPLGGAVTEALVLGFSGLDSYGFHALETLQCMVERRQGGETGVRSVQCLTGEAVWQAGAAGRWSAELYDAALAAIGGGAQDEIRQRAANPAAFLIEYRDGLRATVLMLDKAIATFAFAARRNGALDACEFFLQGAPHGHFTFLVRQIESLMLTGQPPYPIERTLLTTGILEAALHSRRQEQAVLDTPALDIHYQAPATVPDTGIGAALPNN